MKKKKVLNIILAIVQAIAICLFATKVFKYNFYYNILIIILALVYYKINEKYFIKSENKREKIIVSILSLLFSFSIFAGISLTSGEGFTNIFYIIGIIALSVLNIPIFALIFNKIFVIIEKNEIENIDIKTKKRNFFKVWGIIFLLWIPVLLAYYPGIFDYDVDTQLRYIINNKYSTHHPLIHTIILGAFYNLGKLLNNYNLGILLYTILQMLIISAIISYAVIYLKKKGINKTIIYLIIAFYAIFPLNSILVISATKDVYFSAFALAFIVCIMQIKDDNWKLSKKYIGLIIVTVLMLLFRINAMYALIIALVIMLFLGIKKYKNIILAILISLVLCSGIESGLERMYNADTKNERDMLSIPLQQLARVANEYKDKLSEEEYKEITNYIKPERYNKYLADGIKNSSNINKIRSNFKGFIKTWVKYFLKFPTVYVESFLYNTQGYWDINDVSHSEIYGIDMVTKKGYLLTGYKEGFNVEHKSYFKQLESLYEWLFIENNYQKIPIISLMFSPALYIWITIFYFAYSVYKKKKDSVLISTFFIGLLVTLLVGPTCLPRYIYPYVLCIPVLICDLFIKNKEKNKILKEKN